MAVIVPKLSGKALRVYNSLDHPHDYQSVKKNILNAYAITPDGYRQKFRKWTKATTHTYVEFASEKLRLFKKWLAATETTTFQSLLNLIVLEEWKGKLPFNILRHVEERGETDLMRAAELADAYSLLVGSLGSRGTNTSQSVKLLLTVALGL